MNAALGWLLGLKNVRSLDAIDPSLAAPWAARGAFWLVFGLVIAAVAAVVFYTRFQHRGSRAARLGLGLSRGLLLGLLLLTLADPVLCLSLTDVKPPLLYLVFDGTDSMAIEDEYPAAQQAALAKAVQWRPPDDQATRKPSRVDHLRAFLRRSENNFVDRLGSGGRFRIESFLFDGNATSRLRKLDPGNPTDDVPDPKRLADQLTTEGQVTALGAVLNDIAQQSGGGNLGAVVLFSDFAHNSGIAPSGGPHDESRSPAVRLGVPIYTVGLGATEAMDLAVDLQMDARMKRAERTSIQVRLRQTGLQDRSVTVDVTARKLSGVATDAPGPSTTGPGVLLGRRTVALTTNLETIDFPFTPEDAGQFEFVAQAEPIEGEIVLDNNRASREVTIIDDFLRLMYVAYEPSWEWRFVKEVFHRDKLVGMDGFRTYLASSDPRVRESNVLFLPTLTPKRSDFFASDVIFLDDMPRTGINDRFCGLVREFVGQFGGGLVVIAGPRFGPSELSGTALADMLPVVLDPDARLRDERPFRLRLTAHAARYPFMRLGDSEAENAKAWDNLRLLPWYQPVARLQDQSYALAEHPTDTCRDGKTHQPLIAIRQFGAGEVVYLSFNEMWRLRRLYGEHYYRRFWSQLIYRLGMSHALGADKRFVVRTDRQQYRVEDKVVLTVEACDQNFEPLAAEDVPHASLSAELTVGGEGGEHVRELRVPLLRRGVFEAQIPVYSEGEYSIRVRDPVTDGFREGRFSVTGLSAERRSGVRNLRVQEELAAETRGRSYDLTTVDRLIDDLHLPMITERYTRNHPLWCTPLWFVALIGLMLGEWFSRKMIHLA